MNRQQRSSLKSLARVLISVEVLSVLLLLPFSSPFAAQVSQGSDFFEARELLAKQKWTEAALVLRSVLKRSPEFTPATIDLATALMSLRRREEALIALKDAVPRASRASQRSLLIRRIQVVSRAFYSNDDFQLYQDGVALLIAKKYRSARDRFQKFLAQEPDNVEGLLRLTQALELENDFDSAAEKLRLARELNPYEPEILLWLGRAMYQRGEIHDALSQLQLAEKQLPQSETAALWLAEAWVSAGQISTAEQVLEEDLRAEPFHVMSLIALAKLRLDSTGGTLKGKAPSSGVASFSNAMNSVRAAQKELRLALSRIDHYEETGFLPESSKADPDLSLDLRTPVEALKSDIEHALGEADSRFSEIKSHSQG